MNRRTKNSSGRGAVISHRSHLSVTSLIRQNLGEDNMNTLMSSCFCHFFYINSIQFQGQLYNLLLRCLDKSSLSRNCLSFRICGRKFDFTSRDFALITGLKFNEWYDPPVESEIHRSVFRNKQSITLGDIIQAFKKECSDSGGMSTMSLRLAYLLLLFGILLVVGGKNNSIDVTYLHLIDDIDKFNAFPWGCVGYRCLVNRTHRARENLDNIILNDKRLAFNANGFVIALQIWAYEVVPVLSRNCGTQIDGSENLFPRMRKWSATNHLKFDLLNKFILKSLPETLVPMKPSATEQELIGKLGVDEFDEAPMSQKIEDNQAPCSKRARSISNKKIAVENEICTEQRINVMSPSVLSHEVEFLAKRIGDLQKCMMSVCKLQNEENVKIEGFVTPPTTTIPDSLQTSENDNHTRNITPLNSKKLQTTTPHSKTTGFGLGDAPLCKKWRTCPLSSKRSGLRSGDASSIMKNGKKSKDHVTVVSKKPFMGESGEEFVPSKRYDPNEPTFKGTLMKTFEIWRRESKNNTASGRLVLPFFKGLPIDVEWFEAMWSRRGWLNTEHIDSLLNLIISKANSDPRCFRADWTIMEMLCWGPLTSDNEDIIRVRVGQYVSGLQPQKGQLHWARARTVFGIGHINGDHWIAFEVALDARRITVFDTNSTSASGNKVEDTFKVVARNLGKLLQELHIWEFRGMSTVLGDWDIVRFENPPQQVNNADCGVLAIKIIECLVTGFPVDSIDSSRCGVFRHSYCKQIFDLAIPDTTTVELDM